MTEGRHLVVVTLDSLRYDAWLEAQPKTLAALGPVERRWSYASWTAPSHFNLLLGLLPHTSPPHVHGSEHYKADFLRYNERLGLEGIEFKSFLPSMFLPTFLKRLGYTTHARMSMPVLNPATLLNRDFDSYRLMPRHNDMASIVASMDFDSDGPTFHVLNVGETHYPYALADEDPSKWPRISGLHGTLRRIGDADDEEAGWFTAQELAELRGRQIAALAGLESVFAALFDRLPTGTWVVVTADHGDLFGEGGYFGHGPINHDKVLEVPFVEGVVP